MNQSLAEKEVRNCSKRYLLYFAFTTVNKKEAYKEDVKYIANTTYDVFSSDSLSEIKEHRDILLSLVSNINSYVLYIVDKDNLSIIQSKRKFSKVTDISEYFGLKKSTRLSKYYVHCDAKGNIVPLLHFDQKNKLSVLDFFFRGSNEIPPNYKWDSGEYEGWLQFRWGDGKNAIQK